jgi:hypothetical protein
MEKAPRADIAHEDSENPYQPLIDSSDQGMKLQLLCFF